MLCAVRASHRECREATAYVSPDSVRGSSCTVSDLGYSGATFSEDLVSIGSVFKHVLLSEGMLASRSTESVAATAGSVREVAAISVLDGSAAVTLTPISDVDLQAKCGRSDSSVEFEAIDPVLPPAARDAAGGGGLDRSASTDKLTMLPAARDCVTSSSAIAHGATFASRSLLLHDLTLTLFRKVRLTLLSAASRTVCLLIYSRIPRRLPELVLFQ